MRITSIGNRRRLNTDTGLDLIKPARGTAPSALMQQSPEGRLPADLGRKAIFPEHDLTKNNY